MSQPPGRHWGEVGADAACRIVLGVLPHAHASIFYQSVDLRYVWARNVPPSLTRKDVTGLGEPDLFAGPEARIMEVQKREALASGKPRTFEFRLDEESRHLWYLVIVDLDRDDEGRTIGLITTMIDATDQKRREQTLSALLREVSHRSKNLLAIILSLATQTGRYSQTIDGFLVRFRGRLQSLAFSQDLVTASNWRGTSIQDLIRHQTARYCQDPSQNLAFDGPNINLSPNATLHIGLGIHELAVNSLSFGALSRQDGRVSIETGVRDGGFVLHWHERMPMAAALVSVEKRFGSVALERIVPAAIGGRSRLTLENGALDYELLIPETQIEN